MTRPSSTGPRVDKPVTITSSPKTRTADNIGHVPGHRAQNLIPGAEGAAYPALQDHKVVTFGDCGGTMGHDQNRPPACLHRTHGKVQSQAAVMIKMGVRFIQHQQDRVAVKRTGQANSLDLPAREP